MKQLLTLILVLCCLVSYATKPKNKYVKITTNMGECIVKLYNETPLHRDNFIRLAKKRYYDGTLFHRVIKDFMIQGGDPDSRNATAEATLGNGGPLYTIPAEFNDNLFHKKGVIAAARDDTPDKVSSGSQFYLVQGKIFTDEQLNMLESRRLKHTIPAYQREVYKTLGGTPHLDRSYTVYGEIVKGLNMVDSIAAVQTGNANRPKEDVRMTVTVLKKRAAKKLEKESKKAEQK